jgi:virginiamycin B lyase
MALILIAMACAVSGCSVGRVAPPVVRVLSGPTIVNPKLRLLRVYRLPRATTPFHIALGSDGNLWFTEAVHLTIGRITPTGQVNYFQASKRDPGVNITPGPNGNLWYTVFGFPEIDRMTITGEYTTFVVIGNPQDIVEGADGNLWYTDFTLQSIGRMTPQGQFMEFTVPTQQAYPYDITVGPDKNLWFTEINSGKIGRITTLGAITEYALQDSTSLPIGITSAGGKIYAVENKVPTVVEITTSGVITTYQSSQPVHFVDVINDGGGNLLITASHEGKICLFHLASHAFSGCIDVPKHAGETNVGPDGITMGPEGDIWFTSASNDYIGVAEDNE